MTDVVDLDAFRRSRSWLRAGVKRSRGPYASGESRPTGEAREHEDTPDNAEVAEESASTKRPRTARVSRAAIANAARACRAGLTAHLETVSASLRRSIAYAAELEAWADGPERQLPPTVQRYWKLHQAYGGGCGSCAESEACESCVAQHTLNKEYWGLLENEVAVSDLMRIAAGGAEPGESARSALRHIDSGITIGPLEDAIDEAVRSSLARDRRKSRTKARRTRSSANERPASNAEGSRA